MTQSPENQNQVPKKSIFQTLGGGVSTWFGMLTGKGVPAKTATAPVIEKAKKEPPGVQEEDSVAQDMEKAKLFLNKTLSKISKNTASSMERGKVLEDKGVEYAKKVVDVNFTKKVVRIFLVLFFGLIILFVALRLFNLVGDRGGETNVATPTSVPTAPPFKRTEPSIYAEDKLILKIEEDAKVLLNEIVGKTLDDDSIAPPQLDEDINFLK